MKIVIKYDTQSKEMILWLCVDGLYERIHGTLSLGNDWGGVLQINLGMEEDNDE